MSTAERGPKYADLWVRIVSAIILAGIALVDFWKGGVYVTALVAFATGLMLWEYRRVLKPDTGLDDMGLLISVGTGVLAVALSGSFEIHISLIVALCGVALLAVLDRPKLVWMAPGLVYIALAMSFLVELRRDPDTGFYTVLWLVLVVIATDIGGYFAGRSIGGPKIWPRVSPKKTWSGTLGGLGLALLVGVIFALASEIKVPWILGLSVLLAMASQAGDLIESAFKRRFGVKDASNLIPGHGGLLDRFDGLLGALAVFALLSFFLPAG